MDRQQSIFTRFIKAIRLRLESKVLPEAHRLFNGYTEGCPGLILDRYGPTLVVFDQKPPGILDQIIEQVVNWTTENINDLNAVLLKQRQNPQEKLRNGLLINGDHLAETINEYNITYALDLKINQDASFYLDTRNLRLWLRENMLGSRVLNTFAYTGSLGVAAGFGGAKQVIQTDVNSRFLQIAQRSWLLNGLPKENYKLLKGDFFRITGRMRSQGQLFNCVILDPPFFSITNAGKVDLQHETTRLVNKVRALVAHDGWLVVINNALFLSGADFMSELNTLCQSEYLSFHQIIQVPQDITGYPDTIVDSSPLDPSPFNHTTKIAVLKVFKKDKKE
ncbi:MAG: class I SAM-dependent methyltransferase [Chloroflexota bacterium]|nr:class I SAM-dependent methyltransferase [Chloroflexota bacterium]